MMVSVGDEIYDDDFTVFFLSVFLPVTGVWTCGGHIGVSGSYLCFAFGLVFLSSNILHDQRRERREKTVTNQSCFLGTLFGYGFSSFILIMMRCLAFGWGLSWHGILSGRAG